MAYQQCLLLSSPFLSEGGTWNIQISLWIKESFSCNIGLLHPYNWYQDVIIIDSCYHNSVYKWLGLSSFKGGNLTTCFLCEIRWSCYLPLKIVLNSSAVCFYHKPFMLICLVGARPIVDSGIVHNALFVQYYLVCPHVLDGWIRSSFRWLSL